MGNFNCCCLERDSKKTEANTLLRPELNPNIKVKHYPNTNPTLICDLYDTFIFDIDGTLLHDSKPIPGVVESIYKLIAIHKKKVLFYTNGGYSTRKETW